MELKNRKSIRMNDFLKMTIESNNREKCISWYIKAI